MSIEIVIYTIAAYCRYVNLYTYHSVTIIKLLYLDLHFEACAWI